MRIINNITYIEDPKQFFIDNDELTQEQIINIIQEHENIVNNRFCVLSKYYLGKQAILNRITKKNQPNNRAVSNYCKYITDILTGFFMGKNVTYTSNKKRQLKQIKSIMDMNEEKNENYTLASKASIKGQAFEMMYIKNGAIRFKACDTDTIIPIYDTTIEKNMIKCIRYYNITDINNKSIRKIEVYDDRTIKYYNYDNYNFELEKEEKHYFGEVPIIEFANNRYRTSDFEGIINLQNQYNKNNADIANDIEYIANCILVLENMLGTTSEDIKQLKEEKTLLTGENSKAHFLEKNINDRVVQNHRNNLNEDIHKMAYVPDLSKDLPANLSGSAIRQKFFPTDQVIAIKENFFKKGLQKRLRLIANYFKIKDFIIETDNIQILFNRNIPINAIEFADAAIKLNGISSRKTLLKYLAPLLGIEDIEAEMQEIEKEEHNNFDLDSIKDTTMKVDHEDEQ